MLLSSLGHELITRGKLQPALESKAGGLNHRPDHLKELLGVLTGD